MHLLCLACKVCGDVALLGLAILTGEFVHLHLEDVHNGVELHTGVNGELYGHCLGTECLVQAVQSVVPVGLLGLELVDSDDHRFLVLLNVTAVDFGTDLNACAGVDYHNGTVAHVQAKDCTLNEVIGAGKLCSRDAVLVGSIQ